MVSFEKYKTGAENKTMIKLELHIVKLEPYIIIMILVQGIVSFSKSLVEFNILMDTGVKILINEKIK